MTVIRQAEKEKGGQKETWVADEDVRETLKQILLQLRMMNTHLQLVTEESLEEGDT